jgi:hypothetical protein
MTALTNRYRTFEDPEYYSGSTTIQEAAVEVAEPIGKLSVVKRPPREFFLFEMIASSNNTVKGVELVDVEMGESIILSKHMGINSGFLDVLESFRMLRQNWDSYGGDAPNNEVIDIAISFIKQLQLRNQPVYQVAPGPDGEIMVELRSGEKSIEFLFYRNRTKYVDFTNPDAPKQAPYSAESLSRLLESLHG